MLLSWQIHRRQEVGNLRQYLAFRHVAAALLMEVPGQFCQQMFLVFWLKLTATTNVALVIPLGEQDLDTTFVELGTTVWQVELSLVDQHDEREQERVGGKGLDTWVACQLALQLSCIGIFLRLRV